MGEMDLQPVGDLLRAPRQRPPPVGPVRLVQPLPRRRLRPADDRAIRSANVPGEPFLQVLAQPVIGHQLGGLRTLCSLLRLPLRDQRPVLGFTASGRGVATQFPGDRPGSRPIRRAISRTPTSLARNSAISSRSANDR
jgi:hypothetical protein